MARQRGRCVLCIGNDPVHLNFRSSLLKENGWNVLTSSTGHGGILLFEQERVDAVVLDLSGDGVESALIAGELKRLRPKVPVMMLVVEGKDLPPGATAQADALVVKAKEADCLLASLEKLL